MKLLIVGIMAIILASCASTGKAPLYVDTPSGRPDAVLLNTGINEAQGKVSEKCMDLGMNVTSATAYQVVCEGQMSFGQSVLAQMAIGNSYSTTPRQFIKISMAQVGNDVRMQANSWVESQMAFGQVNRMNTDQTTAQRNYLQSFLAAVGAVPPSGSILTKESGFIGVSVQDAPKMEGVYIVNIASGSPASQTDLQICDRIVKVNNIGVVSDYAFVKPLESSQNGSIKAINLEISRNGISHDVTLTPVNSMEVELNDNNIIDNIDSNYCAKL